MYHMILDGRKKAILIPKYVANALGANEEIAFLINDQKGILALSHSPVYMQYHRDCKGMPTMYNGTRLGDKWDEKAGCYIVQGNDGAIRDFCRAIPDYDRKKAYILSGDFIHKTVIGFKLADAKPVEGGFTLEACSVYEKEAI